MKKMTQTPTKLRKPLAKLVISDLIMCTNKSFLGAGPLDNLYFQ